MMQMRLFLGFLVLSGYAQPPQANAQQTPVASESSVTVAFAGDVMLGRLVNQIIQEKGPRYIWGDVLQLLQEPDLTLANLECVIAESGEPFHPPRVFYFRAIPDAIQALTIAGVDYVALANNHAMDFQAPALLETIQHLDTHSIAHAGGGRNLVAASQPALLKASGIRIGVVAFAEHFREYGAKENTPGTNLIRISLESENFRRVREAIKTVRKAGVNLAIFSVRWGPNMRQAPSQEFIMFAHAVMDAGADIYHGHSAHIFQGIEIYKGKPIFCNGQDDD